MIDFIAEKRLFHLYNENISYYFYITEKGILQHLYFGKRLDDIDIESLTDLGEDWSRTYFSSETKKEEMYRDFYYYDHSMSELPSHGAMDVKLSPIVIDIDGRQDCDFRFRSYRIFSGKKKLRDLPSFRLEESDCQTLEILLKDIASETYVLLSYTVMEKEAAIFRNLEILNKNAGIIDVTRAFTLTLEFPRKDLELTHFPGDWCLERQMRKEKLTEGSKRIRSRLGRSSHEHNPCVFLSDIGADENHGDVYGFALVYTGNFSFDISVSKWGSARVNAGIDDEDFCFRLNPGESFICPEAVMVYSEKGFNSSSQTFHDLIRDHLIPRHGTDTKEAILLNSWEGCYMDFDTEKMIAFIRHAKTIGAEMFVLDDGWFGRRDDDSSSLGDWRVNTEKVDLRRIIDTCHEEGLKFGLWIEPEMVNPDSDLFRTRPDWIVGRDGIDLALSRHQLVLDTTNPEVVAYLTQSISDILNTYEIDYVKWDHNRNILNPYSRYLGDKRQGEFFHRLILGVYRLFENLTSAFPEVMFEGCASGGGRFDLGMLYYTPQIWCSDETDPVQRLFIQYGTSYVYPCITMGAHVSKNPITCYRTKAEIALFGTYGFEFDPRKIGEEDIGEIRKVNDIFHRYHREVIGEGNLYRICNPFESNYMAQICVSKNQERAILLFVNILKENNSYRFIKAVGLNRAFLYRNHRDKKIYSGAYLMDVGVNLSFWLDEFSSFLIVFERVESR